MVKIKWVELSLENKCAEVNQYFVHFLVDKHIFRDIMV